MDASFLCTSFSFAGQLVAEVVGIDSDHSECSQKGVEKEKLTRLRGMIRDRSKKKRRTARASQHLFCMLDMTRNVIQSFECVTRSLSICGRCTEEHIHISWGVRLAKEDAEGISEV